MASYFTSGVSEVLQQGRGFATAKLHSCGLKNMRFALVQGFIRVILVLSMKFEEKSISSSPAPMDTCMFTRLTHPVANVILSSNIRYPDSFATKTNQLLVMPSTRA